MKKKITSLIIVMTCLLAFAGCGQKQETAGAPVEEPAEAVTEETEEPEETVTEEAEEPAEAVTAEAEAPAEGEEDPDASAESGTAAPAEESTGMANPWKEFDSAEEAAQNAGIEPLELSEMEIELGEVTPREYRSMDSLVETVVEFPAVEMTVRKGIGFEDGDCSGDYNEYAHEWTQTINGLEVKCFGNDEGNSTKTIWTAGDHSYSIVVTAGGGEENFGLDADSLNTLVSGIQ